MDFSLTEEQLELKAEARRWLDAHFPLDREWDAPWDPASWRELAELGWLGVSVPEEHGGAGLGFLEEAVLIEELGYALYAAPYLSTVALALPHLGGEAQAAVASGERTQSDEVAFLVTNWSGVAAVWPEDCDL